MTLLDAVIFLPLLAFLIILALPKDNHNAIRMFSLISSLAIFVVSLGLIGSGLVRGAGQVRARDQRSLDIDAGHQLSRRHGRHQPLAGDAFHAC